MVMKNYLNVNNWRLRGKDAKRRRAKWKRQRIRRGFCDWDWWDLDTFYLNLFVNSLRHYAKNTIGYSPSLASSFEEYQQRILRHADMFEKMANWEVDNADRRDFEQEFKEKDELTKKAFTELAEVFWSLWD
jgi:hypothetical protein